MVAHGTRQGAARSRANPRRDSKPCPQSRPTWVGEGARLSHRHQQVAAGVVKAVGRNHVVQRAGERKALLRTQAMARAGCRVGAREAGACCRVLSLVSVARRKRDALRGAPSEQSPGHMPDTCQSAMQVHAPCPPSHQLCARQAAVVRLCPVLVAVAHKARQQQHTPQRDCERHALRAAEPGAVGHAGVGLCCSNEGPMRASVQAGSCLVHGGRAECCRRASVARTCQNCSSCRCSPLVWYGRRLSGAMCAKSEGERSGVTGRSNDTYLWGGR